MTTAKPCPPVAPGEIRTYPVLPLRDTVVFPHVIAPLFVGRKKSILALEEAIRSDTFILLATQKNVSDDDPATERFMGSDAKVCSMRRRAFSVIRVRARPGSPTRGILLAGPLALPVVLGRGGIRANKFEGDGATPRG